MIRAELAPERMRGVSEAAGGAKRSEAIKNKVTTVSSSDFAYMDSGFRR
jgi:hypothetical protein